MRCFLMGLLIITFSCSTKTSKSEEVSFIIKDKQDTVSQFIYTFDKHYSFMNKNKLDSVILNPAARKRILGTYFDSSSSPISRHQLLTAISTELNDTIVFQELNINQNASGGVVYSLMTYKNRNIQEEMQKLLTDVLNKMKESTKAEK